MRVCRARAGSNVQLGPGVCLARVPVNGRNFEYLSGEDPFLGYVLVQPTVRGIQSQVRPLLPALLFSLSQPL